MVDKGKNICKYNKYIVLLHCNTLLSLLAVTYFRVLFFFIINLLCLLFFYDFTYLRSMIINMFTLLIVFIVRYNFIIYRSKFASNEE